MLERYKTIYKGGEAEIVEKKSRFIATVRPVESEDEAAAFIEEIRKKYYNARHNCFAYTIGEQRAILRAGDDGEPSQTAGKPMLDVLLGEELYNTAVVVTRYFGGTLLGTGGLVRAYSSAAQEGLKASTIIEKYLGTRLRIHTDYNGIGKIQYLLAARQIPVMDTLYTDTVAVEVIVPYAGTAPLKAAITESTNGKASYERVEDLYYAVLNGEILTGDRLRATDTGLS